MGLEGSEASRGVAGDLSPVEIHDERVHPEEVPFREVRVLGLREVHGEVSGVVCTVKHQRPSCVHRRCIVADLGGERELDLKHRSGAERRYEQDECQWGQLSHWRSLNWWIWAV